MNIDDTIWIVMNGRVRKGKLFGVYINSEAKDTHSWGVQIFENTGRPKCKKLVVPQNKIFANNDEAKKAMFKEKLRGA